MRKIPPAIVIAVALIATHMALSIASAGDTWRSFPSAYWRLGAEFGFPVMLLLAAGMLDLRQRGAAAGFALVAVVFLLQLRLVPLVMKPGVRQALTDGVLVGHLVAMGFLARAVWTRRPIIALAAIASAILVSPPAALLKLISSAFADNLYLVDVAMRLPELVVVVLVSLDLARESEPRPVVVADGFRHASRALCAFSAMAALAGIDAIGLRYGLTALAASALAWGAYGLFRAARAPMNRWCIAASGTAVLYCMKGELSSLPHGHSLHDLAILSLLLLVAAAFVTQATKGLVDKMQLQAKGFGACIMFVTAFAIRLLLVPQSQSARSLVALDVLTGFVIALGAWMLSWLCKLAAQRLESSDSDLPAARIV